MKRGKGVNLSKLLLILKEDLIDISINHFENAAGFGVRYTNYGSGWYARGSTKRKRDMNYSINFLAIAKDPLEAVINCYLNYCKAPNGNVVESMKKGKKKKFMIDTEQDDLAKTFFL